MTTLLSILPGALDDIERARDWYEMQQPGLGDEFYAAVSASLQVISEIPRGFAECYRAVRRIQTGKFPYHIYYYLPDDAALIVIVAHMHRDPTQIADTLTDRTA